MYALPRSNYLKRSLLVNGRGQVYAMNDYPISHSERVKEELRQAGLTKYALSRAESRYLPHVIHGSEHIGGVVYGRHEGDFAMLVATDRRIIFLDNKPLFVNQDEINYFVVSGVTVNHSLIADEVILHTKIKDYVMHTFNEHAARKFVEFIEERSLENVKSKETQNDYNAQNRLV